MARLWTSGEDGKLISKSGDLEATTDGDYKNTNSLPSKYPQFILPEFSQVKLNKYELIRCYW